MTELKKVKLPSSILTEELIFKSLMESDLITANILNEHFEITDIPSGKIGTMADLPAATVVFDLSGSSLSIRNDGAKKFAAKSQYLFKVLTDIIYKHHGIVEKFPGDGISMHFPANEFGKKSAIRNACEAIEEMEENLARLNMNRSDYRFTLTYGEDTIITAFGSQRHLELISIGHAVNVAHKLEKLVKEKECYIGIDFECHEIAQEYFRLPLCLPLPAELSRTDLYNDLWFGVWY